MDVQVKDVKKEEPWNTMFADDVVLCKHSIDRLEEKLEDWRKELGERGMKISGTKSEYLALKHVQMRSCKIQDDELKSVCKFKYLRSHIQRDGGLESEIQHRINCGWNNWRKMSGVLCDKKVRIGLKGKVFKSVVRPAMIYGVETWPITVAQERKMEVAEMRMLRWMCGVTRKYRIRNEFVRGAVKVGPMGKKIQESRLKWYGHLRKKGEEYIGNRVEDIKIEGARRRGRPKRRWKDKMSGDLREKGWKKEETMDRELWRRRIQKSNANPT
ncbi:uncharacterized protein LOC124561545 [Schistocerca americana]|uniref:uncharacterized protein LOC124561545 n=1 Tax=Schistocerca americana TaxID=7009 RepID=UPI001F4FB6F8|nr:uncharacterized protein LOC124561545 [Schistocerca americana]